MPKQTIPFDDFLQAAGAQAGFIAELDDILQAAGYTPGIKEAASGYVVSYTAKTAPKTIVNYVFRKKGPLVRIYAKNIAKYMEILDEWPEAMRDSVQKAPVCRRLLDPTACNSRCEMGFDFVLAGQRQQKCRHSCFFFYLDEAINPHIKSMVLQELDARAVS